MVEATVAEARSGQGPSLTGTHIQVSGGSKVSKSIVAGGDVDNSKHTVRFGTGGLIVTAHFALVDRLRRFADDDEFISAHGDAALNLLYAAVAADHAGQPRRDNVTTDDIHGGLGLIASGRARLDEAEVSLIEAALDRGESLPALARVYDMSRQALTKRYYALGGTRSPLTSQAGGITPHDAVVRYWMARTEADIHGDNAGDKGSGARAVPWRSSARRWWRCHCGGWRPTSSAP